MSLFSQVASLLKRDKGQGLVEYALLVCLICIVVGGAVYIYGEFIGGVYLHLVYLITEWCGC